MDHSEKMVRELRWIKWLLIVVVATFVLLAGTLMLLSGRMIDTMKTESDGARFSELAQELSDAGKYDELIAAANARQRTHPEDANVYWYRGRAYYRQKRFDDARKDIERTGELEPSWKSSHVDDFLATIESAQPRKP
jgi:cytochrome c-type biogenesis protein CcmH/NrfG